MINRALVLSFLFSLGLSCSAGATELTPLQAGTFVLGNHVASVYYTERGGSYDVVTTIAPDSDLKSAPLRFVGSLALGEKQITSFGEFGTTTAAPGPRAGASRGSSGSPP